MKSWKLNFVSIGLKSKTKENKLWWKQSKYVYRTYTKNISILRKKTNISFEFAFFWVVTFKIAYSGEINEALENFKKFKWIRY